MLHPSKKKPNYDKKKDERQKNNNNKMKNKAEYLNKREIEQNETKCEKLEFKNQIYDLNFGYTNKNNLLFFELFPTSIDSLLNLYYYKGIFTYNDLTKLCKSFKMYNSIKEIFSSFCIIFQNKKASLKINENNSFDLILFVNSTTGKEEEVCFPLKRKNVIKDDINNIDSKWEEKEKELNEKMENLEKSLKKENFELKNEIFTLKDDINRYVKTIDSNKKEIKNLKDQIKDLKNLFEEKIKNLTEQSNLNNIKININSDIIQDNNNNNEKNNVKSEKKEINKNMGQKIKKEVKTTDISEKTNSHKINNKNNLVKDNKKKFNKIDNNHNKFKKNQENMKNNKREIHKQLKEENKKKLNNNKVKPKPSFNEFSKQKKIKDVKNKNNNRLAKSFTLENNLIINDKAKEIYDDKDNENNEEEYKSGKKNNIINNNGENNINEDENNKYNNLSDKEKEKKIDEENVYLKKNKTNEISRSDMIDESPKDFNMNVKKLLEDNEIKSRFTEKLNYMNFRIITRVEELQLIENQILKGDPKIKNIEYNLIYRSIEDGDFAQNFYAKCNVSNNLILFKTRSGMKFGRYTKESWEAENILKKDKNAFSFCLNNNKIYEVEEDKAAIICDENLGPYFGDKFFGIFNDFLKEGRFYYKKDNCEYSGLKEDFEITKRMDESFIEEIEAYQLKFDY